MAWTDQAREASIESRRAHAGAHGIAHQRGVAKLAPNLNSPPPDGTYDRYHTNVSGGYMVGGAPQHGTRYTGVWTDKATGKTYREKSQRVNSEVLARSMGRMRNQIAVWDVKRKREIHTGGTGT